MEDRACRSLYLWLLIAWLVLELFLIFDWDHGLARAALLGLVAGLLWLYRTWAGRFRSILGPSGR